MLRGTRATQVKRACAFCVCVRVRVCEGAGAGPARGRASAGLKTATVAVLRPALSICFQHETCQSQHVRKRDNVLRQQALLFHLACFIGLVSQGCFIRLFHLAVSPGLFHPLVSPACFTRLFQPTETADPLCFQPLFQPAVSAVFLFQEALLFHLTEPGRAGQQAGHVARFVGLFHGRACGSGSCSLVLTF
jgi:hypothetical protein